MGPLGPHFITSGFRALLRRGQFGSQFELRFFRGKSPVNFIRAGLRAGGKYQPEPLGKSPGLSSDNGSI